MNLFQNPSFTCMTTVMKPTDEELYQRILKGQELAFDQLYDRHCRLLLGFINKFLENRQMSEEILQDTFIKVLKGPPLDLSKGSFRGWLFMVARNHCIDHLRKQKSIKMYEYDDRLNQKLQTTSDQERNSELDSIKRAACNLPNPFNQLFSLKVLGFSNKEISEIQGVPVGTIKSRLHKMIALIKEEIKL